VKIVFFVLSVFLLLPSVQAKDASFEDLVIRLNNQSDNYIVPKQEDSGKLIKTSLINNNELVFILAGQSNMAGYGTTAKLPALYRQAPANVQFYHNGYPAKMSRFAHFGPEVGFAHAISRRFPHKKIKLIKFAVGGTSLFAWHPHWNLGKARATGNASAGPLFEKLIKTIKRHTRVKNIKYAGILWMQGETDARYPSAARTYARNLIQFVQSLRKELHAPSLVFLMGEVNPPVGIFPYGDIVRKAQRNSTAGIRNSRLISTKGLGKRSDDLHYNTEGQLALGLRFAEAFIQSSKHLH
jgi:hypothetical protein